MQRRTRITTGYLGWATIVTFVASLLVFSSITPGFDPIHDYISFLGAQGQPYSLGWNLSGFILVGILFCLFGWGVGLSIGDRLAGVCFVVAGVGFAMGAIPTDVSERDAPMSNAHFASICISMAGWFFGLARLTHIQLSEKWIKRYANAAALVVVPLIATAAGIISDAIAQRLILMMVFAWIGMMSMKFLNRDFSNESADGPPHLPVGDRR